MTLMLMQERSFGTPMLVDPSAVTHAAAANDYEHCVILRGRDIGDMPVNVWWSGSLNLLRQWIEVHETDERPAPELTQYATIPEAWFDNLARERVEMRALLERRQNEEDMMVRRAHVPAAPADVPVPAPRHDPPIPAPRMGPPGPPPPAPTPAVDDAPDMSPELKAALAKVNRLSKQVDKLTGGKDVVATASEPKRDPPKPAPEVVDANAEPELEDEPQDEPAPVRRATKRRRKRGA